MGPVREEKRRELKRVVRSKNKVKCSLLVKKKNDVNVKTSRSIDIPLPDQLQQN